MLLEKADVQGYLTTEDLMEFYPNGDEDAEHLSAVVAALRRRGVDILDREADFDFTEEESHPQSDLDPYADLERISTDDTVGLYLKEMSRVPLLTTEEELDIAHRIECGRVARKELGPVNSPGRNMAPQKKSELEALVQDGVLAREHLIKANTRLVVSIAKTLYRARRALPGSDPGRQPGSDESRRKV